MTDYAALWDYEAQPLETVASCNLCGTEGTYAPVTERYGFQVNATSCSCGLVFLNPRMTKDGYSALYSTGAYRRLVSAFHGREITEETIKPEQTEYAENLLTFLRQFKLSGRRLLDVGGATGVVAGVIGKGLGSEYVTNLDPAAKPPGIAQSIESWNPGSRHYDLILMCQTADHLLDLSGTLSKLKDCLTKRGMFWVDILDYAQTKEIKIDHPFNLTKETMTAFLNKAGFSIDGVRIGDKHIGFLCH